MNRFFIGILFLCLGAISCKNTTKENNQLAIAEQYFSVLSNSDTSAMPALITDSLLTRETEYDYEQVFSKKAYIDWLEWDALFEPTYKILEMEEKDGRVYARVSKIDKRISFLHQGPIVTRQVLHFEKDKITSIETTKYEVFNDSLFAKNREQFLNWVAKNHPDLNGFIYDQTKAGGLKYLKAITLYNARE